jgi:hypothetical protein
MMERQATDATGNRLDAYEMEAPAERNDTLQDLAEFNLAMVGINGSPSWALKCAASAEQGLDSLLGAFSDVCVQRFPVLKQHTLNWNDSKHVCTQNTIKLEVLHMHI